VSNRRKDVNWILPEGTLNIDQAQLAVLQDVREELRELNNLLRCPNFRNIPTLLAKIASNTTKPRRKRKAKR
jgi:hypothetical protein